MNVSSAVEIINVAENFKDKRTKEAFKRLKEVK